MINQSARFVAGGLALTAAMLISAVGRVTADEATTSPEAARGRVAGYLAEPLDSAALVPRPPADGSAALAETPPQGP
jgi:hypothetical protein